LRGDQGVITPAHGWFGRLAVGLVLGRMTCSNSYKCCTQRARKEEWDGGAHAVQQIGQQRCVYKGQWRIVCKGKGEFACSRNRFQRTTDKPQRSKKTGFKMRTQLDKQRFSQKYIKMRMRLRPHKIERQKEGPRSLADRGGAAASTGGIR